MNYTAFVNSAGGLEVFALDGIPAQQPDITYPAGSITRVEIKLVLLREHGVETRTHQVVITARMPSPALVIQTFSFDTGAEAEEFYGAVFEILGWT